MLKWRLLLGSCCPFLVIYSRHARLSVLCPRGQASYNQWRHYFVEAWRPHLSHHLLHVFRTNLEALEDCGLGITDGEPDKHISKNNENQSENKGGYRKPKAEAISCTKPHGWSTPWASRQTRRSWKDRCTEWRWSWETCKQLLFRT